MDTSSSSQFLNHPPRVSVILSVRDGKRFVPEAVQSILNQTFGDFEFVIIDDGSNDGTAVLLSAFSDPRIVRIRHATSLGLPASLNEAVRRARGAYIARMDADDVSEPMRLARQVAFMTTHPEVGIVGTFATMIRADGSVIGAYRRPTSHFGIEWKALVSTPLIHPSVMARTEILRQHPYDETYANAQDYELWSRLLRDTSVRFANIPERLLRFRIHGGSTTGIRSKEKMDRSLGIVLSNTERFLHVPDSIRRVLLRLRTHRIVSAGDAVSLMAFRIRLAREFCRRMRPSARECASIALDVVRAGFQLLRSWFRGVRSGVTTPRA